MIHIKNSHLVIVTIDETKKSKQFDREWKRLHVAHEIVFVML